jgi:hypothetical protein
MADFKAMPDHSRVWIYQADRTFTESEQDIIESDLDTFITNWTAHSKQLFATGLLAFNKFLILLVDERSEAASGCSIDSSVKMVQDLELKLSCSFFDRLNFAYLEGETLRTIHKDDMEQAFKDGQINDQTTFFNNLISSKHELESSWRVALKDSWHKQFT